MSKKIPISDIKALAKKHDLTHVVLYGYDENNNMQHIVTYGKSVEQCSQAADAGNMIKKVLSWPESLHNAQPSRVKKLEKQIESMRCCSNCKFNSKNGCPVAYCCEGYSKWES